jgi:hypothetical protein
MTNTMQKAWNHYKATFGRFNAPFVRSNFAWCLKMAHLAAKATVAERHASFVALKGAMGGAE